MDNDDRPVGRILSRREVLALLGVAGTAVLAACATRASSTQPSSATASAPASASTSAPTEPALLPTSASSQATTTEATAAAEAALPACVVSPELTEGPYFVDEKLNRPDIRSNTSDGAVKEGALLKLTLRVSKINSSSGCAPLQGAMVDIWHCDALGVYSDASDPGFNTKGQDFLRGYQLTDANGAVQFTTIYPGWYQGRAVHIHFKVRGDGSSGKSYEFTSQFFFDEDFTDKVHAQAPYASKGQRTLKNDQDNIYQQSGGQTVLNVVEDGTGYASTFDIGLQLA